MLAVTNNVAMSATWVAGWGLILAGVTRWAAMGLGFHWDGILGGYVYVRRGVMRLGHVALVALGALNVLFALSALPVSGVSRAASVCWIAGGAAMPVVCFLTGWRAAWRRAFPLPVALLVTAVVLTIVGGLS